MIDIASLLYFSGAERDGGKGAAAVADADAKTKKESDAVDGYNSSSNKQRQQEQEELGQMTMETLRPNWRNALNKSSVMANAIRHHLEPGVHTTMDRDIGLWIALEEDIMSLGSDDSNDLDYGADDDLDDDDDDKSVSSGGSSELSDGGYIFDEPNPFGMIIGGKGKGSIVDDWTDDEEACSSDVSNWSDANDGKKKKKKKHSKKQAASASSSNGSKKKVLVSSKSSTQKQLSAFGIKVTITNKTGDEGGDSSAKKRKSTATLATNTAKKKRGKKKAPSAVPNGKVRSETDKKPYTIGSSVVLRNLTANDVAELNGKRAVVRSGISNDGKQEIEVEGQEGFIPMPLENMRGVCPLFG